MAKQVKAGNNQAQSKVNPIELYTEWYLEQLQENGYIKSLSRETFSLELTPKITKQRYDFSKKTVVKDHTFTMFNPDTYKFDYMIIWDESAKDIFYTLLSDEIFKTETPFYAYLNQDGDIVSLIDVKPPSGAMSFGNNASGYTFPTKQKVLYHFHNIYINKTIPIPMVKAGAIKSGNAQALFTTTFVPRRFMFSDGGGQPRTIHYKTITMSEYIDIKKKQIALFDQRLGQTSLL